MRSSRWSCASKSEVQPFASRTALVQQGTAQAVRGRPVTAHGPPLTATATHRRRPGQLRSPKRTAQEPEADVCCRLRGFFHHRRTSGSGFGWTLPRKGARTGTGGRWSRPQQAARAGWASLTAPTASARCGGELTVGRRPVSLQPGAGSALVRPSREDDVQPARLRRPHSRVRHRGQRLGDPRTAAAPSARTRCLSQGAATTAGGHASREATRTARRTSRCWRAVSRGTAYFTS